MAAFQSSPQSAFEIILAEGFYRNERNNKGCTVAALSWVAISGFNLYTNLLSQTTYVVHKPTHSWQLIGENKGALNSNQMKKGHFELVLFYISICDTF